MAKGKISPLHPKAGTRFITGTANQTPAAKASPPPPQLKAKPLKAEPTMLGGGMAGKAAKAIKGRKKAIDDYSDL